MKQATLASMNFDARNKPTRRERFLGEMDRVIPWSKLLAEIEEHYPTSGRPARPTAVGAGTHAAHSLHAAVVRAQRPCDERPVVRDRIHAALCRH